MTISRTLDELHRIAKEEGIKFEGFDILDDEDLQLFALNFLKANFDSAFEGLEGDE